MQERRQVPRWDVWQKTRITAGEVALSGVIHDLSLKGMRIALASELPVQPRIKLTIDLTEAIRLDAGVQVRWESRAQGAYVYGLSFNVISDDDKERICQYLQEQCRKQWKEKLCAGEAERSRVRLGGEDPVEALDNLIDSFENEF